MDAESMTREEITREASKMIDDIARRYFIKPEHVIQALAAESVRDTIATCAALFRDNKPTAVIKGADLFDEVEEGGYDGRR
jgi:chorismate mutase